MYTYRFKKGIKSHWVSPRVRRFRPWSVNAPFLHAGFPAAPGGYRLCLEPQNHSGQHMRLQFQDFQVEPEGQNPSVKIKDIIRI